MSQTTLFSETQRKQPLIAYLVMVPLVGLMIWAIVQQIILGKPFGENPSSNLGLIAIGSLVFLLAALLFSIRLELQVSKDSIRFRLSPITRAKTVQTEQIALAEVIEYKPLQHFGGWGLRWGKYGAAYTVSGKYGLRIETKKGKKLFIGTAKPEKLKEAIAQLNLTT